MLNGWEPHMSIHSADCPCFSLSLVPTFICSLAAEQEVSRKENNNFNRMQFFCCWLSLCVAAHRPRLGSLMMIFRLLLSLFHFFEFVISCIYHSVSLVTLPIILTFIVWCSLLWGTKHAARCLSPLMYMCFCAPGCHHRWGFQFQVKYETQWFCLATLRGTVLAHDGVHNTHSGAWHPWWCNIHQ